MAGCLHIAHWTWSRAFLLVYTDTISMRADLQRMQVSTFGANYRLKFSLSIRKVKTGAEYACSYIAAMCTVLNNIIVLFKIKTWGLYTSIIRACYNHTAVKKSKLKNVVLLQLVFVMSVGI